MLTNTMDTRAQSGNALGTFLRNRRAKLDPAALGFAATHRRTPGLRREEVAQRANVSATWYTWLEQGRGGAPSARALDRIAHALMLTDAEREHLFLLGLGRPPEIHYQRIEGVTPRLQRVLDALELSPAIVRNATWDIVAWNRAATAVMVDYAALAPEQRNILRLTFSESRAHAGQQDWECMVRSMVAAFRADATRAGMPDEARRLVDELTRSSQEFKEMWLDRDVRALGEGTKHVRHGSAGPITLDYSSFAVDGRPDLGLVIFTPATPADAERVRTLIDAKFDPDAPIPPTA